MSCSAVDKIKAVETYVAGYENGDVEMVMSVFADMATVEDPVGSEPLVGKAAIRNFMAASITLGSKLKLLGSIRCTGNYAAFPFVASLNYEGRDTRIEVIDVFKFDDQGHVIEMRAYFGPDNMKVS